MLLNHARLRARLDSEGRIVTLDRQDRGLWDSREIAEGVRVLQSALAMQTKERRPGRYQVEAAIAALHDDAAGAEQTDWPQILAWYDDLVALTDDPVHQDPAAVLGRAVAVHPTSLDLRLALHLQTKFDEERGGGLEVVDHDANVVHPLDRHGPKG